jgi:hypothetical protein
MTPEFIDNRKGNTLDKAIVDHLATHRIAGLSVPELCVATAYFNPQGLQLIAAEIDHVGHVRLLLGAEPRPEAEAKPREPGDPPEPQFTRQQVKQGLENLEKGLARDRNLLAFTPNTNLALENLVRFLKSGKIEVRRYERAFLHAKAYLFRKIPVPGVIAGSSNLTRAGLAHNMELNLGVHGSPTVTKTEAWFEDLWKEAVPYDLASIYEAALQQYDPYLIYLRVLFALYGNDILEEKKLGNVPLTNFQLHGVWRALRILDLMGGVIIADGVGLGKTFIAGDIMHRYRERRQRILLICPAALRDGTWAKFINEYQLFIDCVSYEQLANDQQINSESAVRHLKSDVSEYSLVIVDEAHNYRNPDAPARARVLRQVLFGKRKDLVLLTATPVNNSLWDLYHLLRYFLKQDAFLADRGILSIRERFEQAMHTDPYSLSPDVLYPIIDATTVKRTRQFIKKHYEHDTIRGPDGREVQIVFPKPIPLTVRYTLEQALPKFFDEVEAALMPAVGQPKLRFARYAPEAFPAGKPPLPGDSSLVGLIRSGLLKRFESSACAFGKTLRKMVQQHDRFIDYLDKGFVVGTDFLHEISPSDTLEDEELDEILESHASSLPAKQFNTKALRAAVKNDRDLLDKLAQRAEKLSRDNDPKLEALIQHLEIIAQDATKEARDKEHEAQLRKVLIFSFYEDTVDWIEDHLREKVLSDPRLKPYRGRITSATGSDQRKGTRREHAIYGFAPISTKAPTDLRSDLFDILICTDVLAEGLNLQQARHIINYDLPWNPMRLVQRHGRIDRIGSLHSRVFLRTIFPDDRLDDLLDLEERIRRKLAQAAASVGVEETPIEDGARSNQSFTETRTEIEKIRKENPDIFERGGTEGAAQTGEEYRQELRRALEFQSAIIISLPWKAGGGMRKGETPGFFFCATIGKRTYLRFIKADAEFKPTGEIISELGTCLRLIECTKEIPRVEEGRLHVEIFSAWERAHKDVLAAWNFETDPANLQPKVRPLNREVAAFLRDHHPQDIPGERFNRTLDILEAPWPRREENLLRESFNKDGEAPKSKALRLIAEIERIGLEPFRPPEALPPVDASDVHLICWLVIYPG